MRGVPILILTIAKVKDQINLVKYLTFLTPIDKEELNKKHMWFKMDNAPTNPKPAYFLFWQLERSFSTSTSQNVLNWLVNFFQSQLVSFIFL